VTIELELYSTKVDSERRKSVVELQKAHEELKQKTLDLSKVYEESLNLNYRTEVFSNG
jgi:hypothetical protein